MGSIVSDDALRVISELADGAQPTPAPAPAAPVSRPFWQPGPCPAWCTNTHRDSDFFEDRTHFAHALTVDLGLYRQDYGDDKSGPEFGPAELAIGATQHYRDAEPQIDLTVPTTDGNGYVATGEQGVRLSIAEARAVRDRLSQLLAAIELDHLDAVLIPEQDGRARVSAEQVTGFADPFEPGDHVRAHLTQWTEPGSGPGIEVTIAAAVTVADTTPDQARAFADRLREAADRIDALAVIAEARNAQTGAVL